MTFHYVNIFFHGNSEDDCVNIGSSLHNINMNRVIQIEGNGAGGSFQA